MSAPHADTQTHEIIILISAAAPHNKIRKSIKVFPWHFFLIERVLHVEESRNSSRFGYRDERSDVFVLVVFELPLT